MADRPAPPDRSASSMTLEEAESMDRAWWWAQTPAFRLEMVQRLREREYGDAANGLMERAIEFVERAPDGSERLLWRAVMPTPPPE